jgi:hypothetical protein
MSSISVSARRRGANRTPGRRLDESLPSLAGKRPVPARTKSIRTDRFADMRHNLCIRRRHPPKATSVISLIVASSRTTSIRHGLAASLPDSLTASSATKRPGGNTPGCFAPACNGWKGGHKMTDRSWPEWRRGPDPQDVPLLRNVIIKRYCFPQTSSPDERLGAAPL